jgi:hypothetical protein
MDCQYNQRLEVAKLTSIGVEFSILDSIDHTLPRKTYSFDTRPTVLQLGTILRVKSSMQAGHLTALQPLSLATSCSHPCLLLLALAFALALALACLGTHLVWHSLHKLAELGLSTTHNSSGN